MSNGQMSARSESRIQIQWLILKPNPPNHLQIQNPIDEPLDRFCGGSEINLFGAKQLPTLKRLSCKVSNEFHSDFPIQMRSGIASKSLVVSLAHRLI